MTFTILVNGQSDIAIWIVRQFVFLISARRMEVQHDAENIGDSYEIPPPEPSSSFAGLKDRIKRHYEICSDYYYSLWYVPAEPSERPVPCSGTFAK